ncbi:methyltransferase domain protein [Rhizoctonia solani AG-3 Rhs1AP]|uniref:Methyltransferase domain protein n=2 Tax=Rhizoctonia solani AG-3 TaxID=1086053 RepID=A0A074RXW5_9AGAM|nr:methyltransferase domain protein [Rhizoctonia solani AG-3 Rhs1AP]KEP49483.1 methyltransferase domain protein [Rhizoctonia solani 123E]
MLGLATLYSLFPDWWLAVKHGIPRTWRAIMAQPRLLFRPSELSRLFFSFVWEKFAPLVDEGAREVKESLVRPYAYGVVLDIGAGHGHTIPYLDRTRVTKYVAVEPNVRMHSEIRDMAQKHGYNADDVVVLGCGAEEVDVISTTLGGENRVDTIVSILTLCTVPDPNTAASALARSVLKSGGQFLWYEHITNPLPDVQAWQRLLTPLWAAAFDGCRLDRDTAMIMLSAGPWATTEMWDKPGEKKAHNLFWHQVGRFVKAHEQ